MRQTIPLHTTTCRFDAPWASPDKTRIVRSEKKVDETIVKQSKKLIEKVLSHIVTVSHTIINFGGEWSYSRTG